MVLSYWDVTVSRSSVKRARKLCICANPRKRTRLCLLLCMPNSAVLSLGNFAPTHGIFGDVWRHVGVSQLWGTVQWVKARELLNILRCTGQAHTTEKYSAQNVDTAKVEKP